jgi:hypothetical protein
MNTTPTLATRFANSTRVLRSDMPLTEEAMRRTAPSIFAPGKHISRSERYSYIPTIDVLRRLREEGFQPFMVAQGQSRVADKTEYTKHMIRLRHGTGQIGKPEANEIVLINSHDGASSYQLMAGVIRYACCNGLVVGDIAHDIRVPHRGNVQDDVIDGAFKVLKDFEAVDALIDDMKAIELKPEEERAFATAALALRFGERSDGQPPAPVTVDQLLAARRPEDMGRSLWLDLQKLQENTVMGGLSGRTAQGRRMRTRGVASIDRNVSLNRALWILAEEMRRLKG